MVFFKKNDNDLQNPMNKIIEVGTQCRMQIVMAKSCDQNVLPNHEIRKKMGYYDGY